MKFTDRVKSWFSGAEGSNRGAVGRGELGGWFSVPFGDGFQRNLDLNNSGSVPVVYACVMAFARAVSQCYPAHKVVDEAGTHNASKTSPASRILRYPNAYETFTQFIHRVVTFMLFYGECICLVVRDDRFAPVAVHIMPSKSAMPYIDPETGELYYSIGNNPMLPDQDSFMAPARDIIHFRQHTPRHPLIGESPIKAAALALGINVALSETQAAFFNNMSRPSGVLSTDQQLNRQQMQTLREAFNEQSKGWAKGELPILSGGLKFEQVSVNSVDAQLIEAQRMSVEEVARVFGVPLPVIGDLSRATLNNTESLISMWLSLSLGSLLENIERTLDRAFNLSANEYIELDVAALLRTDFMGRIEGLTKGISGGLYSPNEARSREGLPPVDGGDSPMVQQQMMPVNVLNEFHEATLAAKQPAGNPPEGTAGDEPSDPADPETTDPTEIEDPAAKAIDVEISRALVVNLFNAKRKAA